MVTLRRIYFSCSSHASCWDAAFPKSLSTRCIPALSRMCSVSCGRHLLLISGRITLISQDYVSLSTLSLLNHLLLMDSVTGAVYSYHRQWIPLGNVSEKLVCNGNRCVRNVFPKMFHAVSKLRNTFTNGQSL